MFQSYNTPLEMQLHPLKDLEPLDNEDHEIGAR